MWAGKKRIISDIVKSKSESHICQFFASKWTDPILAGNVSRPSLITAVFTSALHKITSLLDVAVPCMYAKTNRCRSHLLPFNLALSSLSPYLCVPSRRFHLLQFRLASQQAMLSLGLSSVCLPLFVFY